MSRHPITVRSADATDTDATIGYDPPLRTYFLQAFEDPETDYPRLWLGTRLEEYPDLAGLVAAASAKGFALDGLTDDVVAQMALEASAPSTPSLVERSGWPLR
jgi:hypothetical protein